MKSTHILLFLMLSVMLSSCSEDEQMDLSCLTAEMCDVYLSDSKQVAYVITDDNRRLLFDNALSLSWAQKKDSVYRAMLYYNGLITSETVSPLYAERVLLLKPQKKDEAAAWSDNADPMEFNSAWMTKNGRYLNLSVSMKSGTITDDTQYHAVGLVCDTIIQHSGRSKHCYRVCHAQNDVPMYYTVKTYFSIPTDTIPAGDTVSVSIPTISGLKIVEKVKE